MINIQNILEKSAVHSGMKEALLLVEFSGNKKVSKDKKHTKLNLSLVIDISGSMGGTVKTEMVQVPVRRMEPVRPFNPVQPVWPGVQPSQPWLGINGDKPNPVQHPWAGIVKQNNGGYQVIGGCDDIQWNNKQDMLNQYEMINRPVSISKLEQAKNAAKKAVSQMKDEDFISVVAFDDKAHLICENVQLSPSTRAMVLAKIDAIKLGGSTNLHAGWLMGATEVAKKMSAKSINRVIVLTDGQTNAGIQDPLLISKDVAGLYEKSISTTTFGIGEGFNEDLLQSMSNAGGGNFYYIDDDKKLSQMFDDEFNGLSNLCATEVKMNLELSEGGEIIENLNKYEIAKENYQIPNIHQSNKMYALFKVKFKVSKSAKEFNLGKTVVTFKDEDGKNQKISSDIILQVLSKKEWEALEFNEEVKVQETLLVIANNKINATREIDLGNHESAKSYLSASVAYACSAGFSDSRLTAEIGTLNNTLSSADSVSKEAFRKDLSYQSYNTRNNK